MRIAVMFAASGVLIASLAIPSFAESSSDSSAGDEPFDEAAWQAEWNAADVDGDGRLSREEALAANPSLGSHFDEIDADGDGFITPEEDRAMLRAGKEDEQRGL